jgi:hypothetical protein
VHVLRHPRNALVVGIMFWVIAGFYIAAPLIFGGIVDIAGFTLLIALGAAMSLMAYVLAAGSPRD